MKTNVIIFSKDRTLQLKSLLLSLRHYSDISEDRIHVLYVCKEEAVDYKPLKKEFGCHFHEQNDFLADLKSIVKSGNPDFVMFMVDDLIFRAPFSIAKIEDTMDERKDLDAFCPRMGKHIECEPKPVFEPIENDLIMWETSEKLGRYWNYFWELSSSLYRRELVEKYLSRCRPLKESFPNPLEWHYYVCMPSTHLIGNDLIKLIIGLRFLFAKKKNRIACFDKSICLTQGVNLVANRASENDTVFTPAELHQKMLEGYVVDFKCLEHVELRTPQPGGEFFRLILERQS